METLICVELLHRAAVGALIRGRPLVSEFAGFATSREPDPDGVACVEHLRRTFAIAAPELDSVWWRMVGDDALDRDAQALAFLGHWVARRFFRRRASTTATSMNRFT